LQAGSPPAEFGGEHSLGLQF